MAEDKEPFLSRWSRLKREEKPAAAAEKPVATPPALPAVDKLTPDSDFSPFMHPQVGDALRRAALKKLFSDPHFNVPDPYEAFSGDWTVGEAIPPEMMATLNQARVLLFDDKKKEEGKAAPEPAAATAPAEQPKQDEPGRQDA